jgi:hypothetical protein
MILFENISLELTFRCNIYRVNYLTLSPGKLFYFLSLQEMLKTKFAWFQRRYVIIIIVNLWHIDAHSHT